MSEILVVRLREVQIEFMLRERERFSNAIRKGWASNALSDAVWLIIPQRKNTNAKKPTSL